MADADDGTVELRNVSKHFGDVVAVDGVDLTIASGAFFSLLGPSGSGKTTVLRMVAGFESPTTGTVYLGGRDVTGRPPYERDVNTVFQDYALFPHLTIQDNVEYGLKVKGIAKEERQRLAGAALEMVRLGGFGGRRPDQLSGGQRQRVALARALVNRPRVLLLDEPLGALDLKLREEMQVELKAIQSEIGITFVLVTHDQGEALSMSTDVAVFNKGRIEQVGSPRDVYERPSTSFVAGFVGTGNLIDAEVSERLFGSKAVHSVRPERISLAGGDESGASDGTPGTVADVQYLGTEQRVRVDLDGGGHLTAATASGEQHQIGDRVSLSWPPGAVLRVADTGDPLFEETEALAPADEAVPVAATVLGLQ